MLTQSARPFTFDGIIGQNKITSEMKRRSKTLDFPSVMIFEGQSGCGKTTLAFIIAALINDTNPIKNKDGSFDPNPESPVSRTVLNETFSQSVMFYDASRMSKEDVKDLEKTASEKSMFSNQKKVLIIDEAQELTNAGKGVVLKLLEKKRKDVYFILCTMNISKFDKAVKSRGTNYNFKSVQIDPLAEFLFNTLKEMPEYETVPEDFISEGLFTIAAGSGGSVREALQMFERCIYGQLYTEVEIQNELNIVSDKFVADVVNTLFVKRDAKGLIMLDDVDFEQFFFISRKGILNAYTLRVAGEVNKKYARQQWMFKNLVGLPHQEILAIYEHAIGAGFKPNEDLFKTQVLNFLTKGTVAPIRRLEESVVEKPVRKTRSTK